MADGKINLDHHIADRFSRISKISFLWNHV